MKHQWKLVNKAALTTSMWVCERCELIAILPSNIEEFDTGKVHQYHFPKHWSKLDKKETIEQVQRLGEPDCMTPDDRIIRDIIL